MNGIITYISNAKWCKALRSGEYEQTNGQLYLDEGYCCLGVRAVESGLTHEQIEGELMLSDVALLDDTLAQEIPRKMVPHISGPLAIDGPWMTIEDVLASLNDDWRLTFEEIADFIEVTLDD